jgi:hypothetical protein
MIGSTMNELPAARSETVKIQRIPVWKPFVNHNAMGGRVNASPMPR